MAALPPILVELKATSGEFMAKMGEARHEIAKLETEGHGHFAKFQEFGKAALLGVTGVAVALGTVAVKAAIDGQEAHARLAQAVLNTGGSMEELEPKVKKLSGQMSNLGFTNDEVETALAQLTTSLRDPQKAMNSMGLAADLARFKHLSLADASLTVAKAMEGQLRPLKQLGIDLPVAAGGALKLQQANQHLQDAQKKLTDLLKASPDAVHANSKAHKAYEAALAGVKKAQENLALQQSTATIITHGLAQAVGGQAAAASKTFAGQLEVVKAKGENLAESIGMKLLPIIEHLISDTLDVVHWLGEHKTTAEILAGVVGGVLVTAITAYVYELAAAAVESVIAFGSMALAAAGWAAGMLVAGATALLPFLPLIAAVAAVGFAAYELYKHWDQVWGFIKSTASDAWRWIDRNVVHPIEQAFGWVVGEIKQHWDLLLGILVGPIGFAVVEIAKHWDQIVGAVRSIPSRIASAASGMWDGIKEAFREALDWIIDRWNSLEFSIPGFSIPGIGSWGGFSFGVPQIPRFADGGYVPGAPGAPLLAVVHGGEYVSSRAELAGRPRGDSPYGKTLGRAPQPVLVSAHLYVDGKELHTTIQRQELRYQQRNGRAGF